MTSIEYRSGKYVVSLGRQFVAFNVKQTYPAEYWARVLHDDLLK